MKPKILAFEGDAGYYRFAVDGAFAGELRKLGDLTVAAPEGVPVADLLRGHDIFVSHHASPFPAIRDAVPAVAREPGRLKFVVCTHGGGHDYAPLLDVGVTLSNWGDAPGHGLGLLSLTLLLAMLRDLPAQIDQVRTDGWSLLKAGIPHAYGGTPEGLRVGVYGLGFGGRAFVEMARPLGMVLRAYDPYARPWPDGVECAATLADLLADLHALVVLAALTDETRGSVAAELLARLPDGGIVVNVARGAIVDQAALFAELTRGRLRAGLDVLEPDYLQPGDPARQLPNCIFTAHVGPPNRLNLPALGRNERNALDSIRRIGAGEPLRWVVDRERLSRMT